MGEDLTDFASFCNSRKKITNATPITSDAPQLGFFQARLNKDNLWNLMFALGMTFGLTIVFCIIGDNPSQKAFPYSAAIIFWLTILGVPLLTKKFNGVSFSDNKFFNKQGAEINLKKQIPNALFMIVTTIVITALAGSIFDNHFKEVSNSIAFATLLTIVFFIPTLFFNAYNCPISILFNANFWKGNGQVSNNFAFINHNRNRFSSTRHKSSFSSPSQMDYMTKPQYSYMLQNIRHRR